ncbi:MAG: DUF547 domain-containing protein [Alphaproteobacteria bacterium]|nr:DUF547 domain-containing protein [Alphaproteobacteria bacterium]
MLSILIATTAWAGTPSFDATYADYAAVLDGAVTDAGVDYDKLAGRKDRLDRFLTTIATVDPSGWTRDAQLAFWVNAYNATTLDLVLDHLPLTSIRDLDGGNPWKARTFQVGGRTVTLDQMEHEHARKLADGRVHAVINCASKGCPPLPAKPLRPEDVDAQLDAAARRWVRTNAWVAQGSTLALSHIFEWYADDFTAWRVADVPGANPAQAAGVGFVRAFGAELPSFTSVGWHPYDWSLNRASP